jgi:hypothetical protein
MNKQGKRWSPHIFIAGLLLAGVTHPAAGQETGISWAGTWASPPVEGDTTHNLGNRTLRQIVHTSVAGSRARVQISNLFGTQPLRIEDVHIAQKGNGSSIVPGTDLLTLPIAPTNVTQLTVRRRAPCDSPIFNNMRQR